MTVVATRTCVDCLAAIVAWTVIATGFLQVVAALVGAAVLLAFVGALSWLASDPALRR